MTAVGGCDGQVYPLERDGELHTEELRAFSKRVGAYNSQFRFFLRFPLNLFVPIHGPKDRLDTTVEKSMELLRKPGFEESYKDVPLSLESLFESILATNPLLSLGVAVLAGVQ